jgi:hypothetical protein
MTTLGTKENALSAIVTDKAVNEAEWARTLNLWIDSPIEANDNSLIDKKLESTASRSYTPAYKNSSQAEKDQLDLASVAAAWPDLPEHIKAAIKTLVHGSLTGGGK